MSGILVVEDEKHLADGLRYNLEAEGYSVDAVSDAEAALELLKERPREYDVMVLDVMLPGMDGFTLAANLRAQGQFVPILMLTARGQAEDVLRGFESGADDYLPKPFELSVLIARIHALLRRREWFRKDNHAWGGGATDGRTLGSVFQFGGRKIDFEALELYSGSHTVQLTLMEAELLRYLIEHDGRIVSRNAILEEVWGLREDTDTRAIDNFIVRLRKYIEDEPSRPKHLLTVRGVGYKFVSKVGD
ncbi:MAG TPA: response regulator transcription factor [Pyrinomonadaceae bacterium]|jgi:Response regulators consisting of a CheY-like receiver domain and a winged-helix DNA-binding domain|nr:response regulator transcription factor [Pyrinomonadaceae bacterium]